ncbi:ribokinase [Candidatus Chloroploca sp. M-50]|uniref:Ribokinase n=1 Tax=Candidatus Chloroploca mongolica TaxID=2528176 RepID=A0ABS4D575_9CHLR|nr:ribokinase [Candidatus Chloroploca mongolica]MBP1464597.1 ribokinase [Candidatus Chloroploca mongolica]
MKRHILVVGSLNMDLVVQAPRHPQPGETILGGPFATIPGGKGANQSVAAARLGAQVVMIGRTGDDHFGEELRQRLAADHIEINHIAVTPEAATGIALIAVDATGQNSIIVALGANALLQPEDIQAAEALFRTAAVLLVQLETPVATVTEALRLARRYRVPTLLNPAPAQPLGREILGMVDYLLPNEHEVRLLSGGKESPAEAARQLRAQGVGSVIVTLGAAGALVVDQEGATTIAPFRVEAVDTTAAGDAFAGAFAVALYEGMSPREAAIWGAAAGAITVTRAGAQPALPRRAEVEALVAQGTPK